MKNFLNKYKYQILLFFIVLILFFVNYLPNTYLSGWDNLQTELNPGLAVKRAFFSVWEEYQSFGLTAGMAHATDLPRAIFIWIISFILPNNIIRYFYHFLMLFLGGIGLMSLMRFMGLTQLIAFLGALFYMLNLGTVQIFYVPFESFSTFFAFLPWAIWSYLHITYKAEGATYRKNLLLFLLINILGVSSFYTQQLFLVYILVLGCFTIGILISHTTDKEIRKILLSFLLIIIINSFWILPQIYFLKTNGGWVTQSKANQIATKDTLYQNLSKGTIGNFLRLEGFYFDLKGINKTFLFEPWKNHFSGITSVLAYVFGGLMIIGILSGVEKKLSDKMKHQTWLGFFLIFLLSSLALLSSTPPFSWLNIIIRENTFINQIFRSPFTKFIIPYSLVYSYFFVKGLSFIKVLFFKNSLSRYTLCATLFVLIILYSLPSFQGYFFSSEMKVKIPDDYFQVIKYFKQENASKRIALFPDYTFWGWFFTSWGYNGSGFLWYGIEQPIVSRTFDPWSPKSESYFWEIKQATEGENLDKFEAVLDKYNIDYLIIDYSLIPVTSSYKSLSTDRLENLINQSQKISLVFQGKRIALFKIKHPQEINNFVSLASNLPNIGPKVNIMTDDRAYQQYKDYISVSPEDIYYPYPDLMTQTRIKNKNWVIEESANLFSINSSLNLDLKNYQLNIPKTASASIYQDQNINNLKLNLISSFDKKNLKINFEKQLIKSFDVSSFKNNIEFVFEANQLPQKYGYLIKIRSKNIKGSPLFFYIIDNTKKQSMIEENLVNETEYFILPSKFDYGLGYSLVFQKKSYQNYPSENALKELSIYLFPYEELKNTKFIKNNLPSKKPQFHNSFDAKKINYFTYKVKFNEGKILILNQSFDPGWIAFADGKILSHILVNNWANGWIIPEGINPSVNDITIIFWPQYLQFLGFGLLIITFVLILRFSS